MIDADENSGLVASEEMRMPVAQAMTLAAHELRMLSDNACELQDAIGDVLAVTAADHAAPLYQLQSLDRLCQSIAAVADFVEGLGRQANPHWWVDAQRATADVKLSDLANRLGGRPECEGETGIFDGFDDFAAVG